MAEHRTDGIAELVDALASSLRGWSAEWREGSQTPDLVVRTPTGASVAMEVKRRTSVTPSMAERLAHELPAPALVIADLIDSGAGDVLRDAGLSFWDRRGRLVLQSDEPAISVDTATRSHVRGADGPASGQPITGRAGIAVALATCMWPDDPPGVRRVAGLAEMSPSSVSEARSRLVVHGLLSSSGAPLLPELFWAVSDVWVVHWRPTRTWPSDPGWCQAGHGAAVRYGARTLTGVPQAYAPSSEALERHLLRHPGDDREPRYLVAVPPTPLVRAAAAESGGDAGLPMVHPVVAALDLSRDGRGREILSTWRVIDGPPDVGDGRAVWQRQ